MKDKIEQARKLIDGKVLKTDLVYAHKLTKVVGGDLYLKLENLQIAGSFKVRGAMNKIMNLTEEEKKHGVVAASAGNHAQGVAIAATKLGVKATIVMPKIAPMAKINATQEYGAEVLLHGDVFDEALAKAIEMSETQGMTLVHPYDDELVTAGQGTIGMEILEQLDDIDQIVVPIGGGGLIGGIASYVKAVKPEIKIIGVEAENAASMKASFEKGAWTSIKTLPTVADGIAVGIPGKFPFELVKKNVSEIVAVSDDQISEAMLYLLEKCKLVVEGAGCASVAACLSGKVDVKGKKTVCIISGGNIDVSVLESIINRALISQGRRAELDINVADKMGEINKLLNVITEVGANIVTMNEGRGRKNLSIREHAMTIVVDTRDRDHLNELLAALKNKGYSVDY